MGAIKNAGILVFPVAMEHMLEIGDMADIRDTDNEPAPRLQKSLHALQETPWVFQMLHDVCKDDIVEGVPPFLALQGLYIQRLHLAKPLGNGGGFFVELNATEPRFRVIGFQPHEVRAACTAHVKDGKIRLAHVDMP